jgi:endonuclease G
MNLNGPARYPANLSTFALRREPKGPSAEETAAPRDPEQNYQTSEGHFNDFVGRDGYDPDFLGANVAMPILNPRLLQKAAPLLSDPEKHELKYANFSVIQHAERATPIITAVNIDGAQYQEMDRKGSWVLDGRIAREHQMGNEAYKNNDLDRGHLVRRKDAQWGAQAQKASGDTFAYTNAALQHSDFNQKSWLDLENNVLFGAVAKKEKKTVFTGPILRDDDPSFDNDGKMLRTTQIPTAFWKVQVWNDDQKGLQAEAYVVSQAEHLDDKPDSPSPDTTPPPLKAFRVSIDQLEKMTDLDFGDLPEGPGRTESDQKAITEAGLLQDDRPWLKERESPPGLPQGD